MKNKQKNGQTFGPKMAKALKLRCDKLEDAVVSQQEAISALESQIVNNNMAHAIMKKRYEDAMQYLELNRPEILKLMKTHAKHGVLASQGKLPAVQVKLVKRKGKVPVIPPSPLPEVPEVQNTPVPVKKPYVPPTVKTSPGLAAPGERYDFLSKKFVPLDPSEVP